MLGVGGKHDRTADEAVRLFLDRAGAWIDP